MKKFLIKALISSSSYVVLALLAYGSLAGITSLVGVAAAVYWVIIILGLLVGVLISIFSYVIPGEKDEQKKQKLITIVQEAVKKRNPILRGISWIFFIVITLLLAYSGWVFTAVSYALSALIVKFLLSIARDNVKEATS
ncbi:hypothetical protein [Serratia ureilytica]|uniref:hypothetical protein n=1 Tax=Serratia ureilytica TaxID=300181 RepID=UPI00257637DF|nr:hypothetical protein [Serratia ureilytica]MDM1841057.1 hypothetical protein [Serratia ureilytica]